MRFVAFAAAALVVLVTGAVQLAGSTLYGAEAVPGSLPHALAGDWPLRAAEHIGLDRVAPLRLPLARAAIERNDLELAGRLLEVAGSGATSEDLRGRLALRRGDVEEALRRFLAAGDYTAASRSIDDIGRDDPLRAYGEIRAFEARVARDGPAAEVLGEIAWREGQLAAAVAYTHADLRAEYNLRSIDAYGRALKQAPNEAAYLLAFGYQALVVGRIAEARDAYERALRAVSDPLDAELGLAAADALLGDCAAARPLATRARASGRFVPEALSPLLRAALARCP